MTNNTNNETKNKETKASTSTIKRDFILNENVTESSVKDIVTGILAVNRHDDKKQKEDPNYVREPIHLVVSSYGGSAYDGFGLVAVIDSSETPVYTYCYSKAMSAGLVIFSAGHKRFAHPLARFMYHEVATGLHGKLTSLKHDMEEIQSLQDTYDGYLLATTNLPKHIMEEKCKYVKDWYLSAQEAFNYGLVDELITSKRNK